MNTSTEKIIPQAIPAVAALPRPVPSAISNEK
jgi:hypothetical protein